MSAIGAVRLGLRVLDAASSRAAGAAAERLFFSSPRTRLSPGAAEFLATGRPLAVRVEGRRVEAWSWGEGPVVALVHGWGSRGARWRPWVEPLVAAGRRVVVFDAIGHGASEGTMSSMPEIARTLRAVREAAGGVQDIVAHSLGGAATTLALHWGAVTAERLVFLAPASDPAHYAAVFAETFRLSDTTMRVMKQRSERRLRFRWDELHVPDMARRMAARLLVVHDQDDPTVPYVQGAAIAAAWPGARLVTTTGLGHHDVVRDPAVVARGVAFVTGRPEPTGA